MSRFLKIFAPAAGGAGSVLAMAYVLADQFVVDLPAPLREVVAVSTAEAQEAEAPSEGAGEEMAGAEATEPMQVAMTEAPAAGVEGGFGLGRPALEEEIAAWDIDIRPDGQGLPVGSGDVWTGEEVFIEKCAVCHGDFGEGAGRWPVLAGGDGTLESDDPVKTVGSYWPYLSTVYDYIHRAMPFGEAQSLTPDEVYALTAYILNLNYVVEDDFVLSNETFTEVVMPNQDNFYMDDRAEVELPLFSGEVCMENCKETVEITMRARVLDVTPDTEEGDGDMTEASAEVEAPAEEVVEEAVAEEPAAEEAVVEVAAADPALIAAGEGLFRQCRSCHQVGPDARNGAGPHLNGLAGRTIGAVDGFRYSNVFQEANAAGDVWTDEALAAFLADPRGAMPGTKMAFRGVGSDEDIAAILAYLADADG